MLPEAMTPRFEAMLATALAPLQPFLADPAVTDLLINADGRLWVERPGQGCVCTALVLDAAMLERLMRLLAAAHHSPASPCVSAVLPGGARFHGLLPPLVAQPVCAIRTHAAQRLTLDDLVTSGMLSARQGTLLQQALRARQSLLVVGPTGSGKTTLLNALLTVLASLDARVLVIEDTPELVCPVPNAVSMTTSAELDMRQAIREALRLRPDRLVIGEVRDGAALEMLKAWTTGHAGCGTLHAEGVQEALLRLELLVQEVVVQVPKRLLTTAVQWVVCVQRTAQAPGRRVSEIARLTGLDGQGAYTWDSVGASTAGPPGEAEGRRKTDRGAAWDGAPAPGRTA